MSEQLTVKVFRFDPTKDSQPRYDTFQVPKTNPMAVLDVVFYIQNNLDRTLGFRCSCRCGMCGSCAMYINGKSRLACRTKVADLGNEILIMPLPNLPIIKDLLTNMDPFFEMYERVKPYFIPKDPNADFAIVKPDSDERELIDSMLECLTCGCCYSMCTICGSSKEYLGPSALTRAYCLVADKRDGARLERMKIVAEDNGVWRCHTQFNCMEVCPKDISPTHAIQQLRKKCVFKSLGFDPTK